MFEFLSVLIWAVLATAFAVAWHLQSKRRLECIAELGRQAERAKEREDTAIVGMRTATADENRTRIALDDAGAPHSEDNSARVALLVRRHAETVQHLRAELAAATGVSAKSPS